MPVFISGLLMLAYNIVRVLTPGQWLEGVIEPYFQAAYFFLKGLGV